MLQRPPAFVAPLPQSVSPSGSSTPVYSTQSIPLGQDQDALQEYQDNTPGQYPGTIPFASPSAHGSPGGYDFDPNLESGSYFPPTAGYVAMASPCPPANDSRVPGVTFEIVQQYQSSPSNPEQRASDDALFRQDRLPSVDYAHLPGSDHIVGRVLISPSSEGDHGVVMGSRYDDEETINASESGMQELVRPSVSHDPIHWLEEPLVMSTEYSHQTEMACK